MNIGENIKKIRLEKRLTRHELACKLKVSDSSISRYENNKREPNMEAIHNIADVLNVSVNDLLMNCNTDNTLTFLHSDNDLIVLEGIFSKLGYKLNVNDQLICILRNDEIITEIPEKEFIKLGKNAVRHINEFSAFEIEKIINTYQNK